VKKAQELRLPVLGAFANFSWCSIWINLN
jgi:hypothetical protein